jgi:hypothetical protein
MARNKLDVMIGCASIPTLHQGVVSGEVAGQHLAPTQTNPFGQTLRTKLRRAFPYRLSSGT